MEKLNIKKSLEDENTVVKTALEEANGKLGGFETKAQIAARQEKVNPLFDKALGEFIEAQQKEGKPNYKLSDQFVNKESLYKEVDIDNETLRNAHFKEVLQGADKAQQTFMEKTGMDFTNAVQRQGLPAGHYEGGKGINQVATEATKIARKNGGSMESVIAGLAQLHEAEEKESS